MSPFPDYPLGTDVHYWVSSPDMGLAHIARDTPAGPTHRMACTTVAESQPNRILTKDRARCGFCVDWQTEHPKVKVIDYGRN